MKKRIILLAILFNLKVIAQTYPSLNINLLARLNPEKGAPAGDNRKYSGCWGWVQSSKNKEYALVGTSNQTYFIDVTNPTNPIICDSVKGKSIACTWREIKTYQNYCYIASDGCTPSSFQIVDLKYLPSSRGFVIRVFQLVLLAILFNYNLFFVCLFKHGLQIRASG